jgi:Xaa-Pro aminopeptidase
VRAPSRRAPGAPSGPVPVAGRIERLRPALAEAGCDALLVSAPSNVRYLTGFNGSAAVVLVGPEEALLVTDGRYRLQAAEQLASAQAGAAVRLAVGGAERQRQVLTDTLGRWGIARLGLEADHLAWAVQRRWAEWWREVELVASSGLVEGLRCRKDDAELEAMSQAAALADAALDEVRPMVAPGRSEAEVALALDTAMRRLGAEDRAFATIVASGPNAAKPHARPTRRVIEVGDAVVVDFGAVVGGYRSDMTRTFFAGRPPQGTMAEVLDVVRRAQATGLGVLRPGAVSGEVDAACRAVVEEAGLGEAFEHATGHGVGLDIHEAPWVGAGTTAILDAGTVVTVEPGVYLAGVGGVRIEDTAVVTDEGCRLLTRFPKDLVA